ncbi:hypothetical protein B0H66DRAFT_644465 [Apodospora peruviana]|uniref:F-box domain-containing protein n=1 Tax=Apodospora peruviana TaxID=516989 RepID=A0AAE0HUE7_9PEZI|nr:hypothetical protein B0H66DRAFT_644465 [Apodospora peruviana]
MDVLDILPPELWESICSHLQHSTHDLVKFRCACRVFANVGLRFALAELTIFCHQDDFARLREIAGDPQRAKLVRSITYIPFMSMGIGRGYIPPLGWRWPPMPSDTELQHMHSRFCEAVLQGRKIVDQILDIAFFAEVLPKLPGLQDIWLRNSSNFGDEIDHIYFKRAWFVRKSPYDDTGYALRRDRWYHPGSGHRGIAALMAGLAQCKPSQPKLRCGSLMDELKGSFCGRLDEVFIWGLFNSLVATEGNEGHEHWLFWPGCYRNNMGESNGPDSNGRLEWPPREKTLHMPEDKGHFWSDYIMYGLPEANLRANPMARVELLRLL